MTTTVPAPSVTDGAGHRARPTFSTDWTRFALALTTPGPVDDRNTADTALITGLADVPRVARGRAVLLAVDIDAELRDRVRRPVLTNSSADGGPALLVPTWYGIRISSPAGTRRVRAAAIRSDIAGLSLGSTGWTVADTLPQGRLGAGRTASFALRGSRLLLVLAFVAGLVGTALGIVVPVLALAAAGDVNSRRAHWILLAAVALATSLMVGTAGDRLTTAAQSTSYARVERAVWHRLLALPTSFFHRHPLRSVIGFAGAVSMVRSLLGAVGIDTLLAAISAAGCSALLFFVDWRIAVVAMALAIAVLVAVVLLSLRQQRHDLAVFEGVDDVQAVLYPALLGIDEVHAYQAEPLIHQRWSTAFGRQKTADDKGLRYAEVAESLLAAAQPLMFAVLLPTAAVFSPGLGTLALITIVTMQFSGALGRLAGAIPAIFSIALTYHRLSPVLEATPEVNGAVLDAPTLSGAVTLEQFDTGYPDSAGAVLDGIDLHIAAGEFVAVVGSSGSGKSTLLRVLLGLLPATSGQLRYDGIPLPAMDVDQVRSQIGYVPQDGRLLRGSIRAAILGDHHSRDDERAMAAAAAAGLATDLLRLPMGLDTRLSDGDAGFSGGQSQRLLLARALARDPRILLLDEATSALDDDTQQQVSAAVAELDITRVVVAHRWSTIRNADRVVVLAGGRVVQTGTFDELIARPGELSRLFGSAPTDPELLPQTHL